jgi:hypothetical protein
MSSRSERYLANAEKCQQYADAAYTSGTKRLYGELASQWRHLAEQADGTDGIGAPLLEKIRHAENSTIPVAPISGARLAPGPSWPIAAHWRDLVMRWMALSATQATSQR